MIICVNSWLQSFTWHIKQDGSGNFTTIQAGINAASYTDTVLVYPGTYYENIDYLSKSITVASLNLTTGEEQYINLTIIDGNFSGSCVYMEGVQNGIIHGFTIQHGSGTLTSVFSYYSGGGLFIYNSVIELTNCTITENESENSAAIVLRNSIGYLAGTEICFNHSLNHGNIVLWDNAEIYFDEDNLCSVYLNTAATGNDFWINGFDNLNIVLDKFTLMQPDDDLINMVQGENYTFSCLQSAVEQVEADLYVASWGNDENSGITAAEPLQSIAYGLIKIKADSLHQRIIHLADGTYSTNLNNQRLPLNLKSYVSIIGESEEGTILDGDEAYGFMAAFDEEKNIRLQNLTCQNGYFRNSGVQVWFYENTTADIENLTIKDCSSSIGITSALCLSSGSIIKNLTIDNVMGGYVLSLWPVDTIAENISISNSIPNPGDSSGGALLVSSNLYIIGEPTIVKNLEVVNNINNENEWNSSASVAIVELAEAVFINSTIASNNNAPIYGAAITLYSGKLTLINSIVHGNYPHQVRLTSNSVYGPSVFTVQNSLIEDGVDGFSIAGDYELNWLTGNFDADPLFIDDQEDFHLQDSSPCIGAGIDAVEINGIWYYAPEFDIEGNPRPNPLNSMPDLGAYENPLGSPIVKVQENLIVNPEVTEISIYPNPFNPSTTIKLELAEPGNVELSIYNIKGQKVKTLMDCITAPGKFELIWNGRNDAGKRVTSGEYIAMLKVNDKEMAVRKMMLLK